HFSDAEYFTVLKALLQRRAHLPAAPDRRARIHLRESHPATRVPALRKAQLPLRAHRLRPKAPPALLRTAHLRARAPRVRLRVDLLLAQPARRPAVPREKMRSRVV